MEVFIFLFSMIGMLACIQLGIVISEIVSPDEDAAQKKTEAMLREMNRKTFEAQQELIREAMKSIES